MTDSTNDRVAAVVLAAGSSTRMGRNKLLLPVDGEPMIRGVVKQAIRADLNPIVVVVGHESARSLGALAGFDFVAVENREHELGMTSSLRAGIAALPSSVGAAIMILGDMPFVDAGMLRRIAETHLAARSLLVISDYAGVQAPPTLFSRDLFPELLALDDEHCPRRIINRHFSRATILHWPSSSLKDLDSPEDASGVTDHDEPHR